jgi:hypothetical protein
MIPHTAGFIGSSSGTTCANQDSRKRCGLSQTETSTRSRGPITGYSSGTTRYIAVSRNDLDSKPRLNADPDGGGR